MTHETQLREHMVLLGKSLFDRGFGVGTSGNLSARIEGGWLATPTNSCLGRLHPDRLSKLDAQGRHVAGDPPSKEVPLHMAVYNARPKAGAVVHLHSFHATAVSCLADVDQTNALPPLTAYQAMRFGKLPVVPYFRPGEPHPERVIAPYAAAARAMLLANHGSLVSEATLDAAVSVAEEVEESCKLFLMLRGRQMRTLTSAQLEELAAVFGS
jgi:3-dehydro-4-phosphotetronate decarboxylase